MNYVVKNFIPNKHSFLELNFLIIFLNYYLCTNYSNNNKQFFNIFFFKLYKFAYIQLKTLFQFHEFVFQKKKPFKLYLWKNVGKPLTKNFITPNIIQKKLKNSTYNFLFKILYPFSIFTYNFYVKKQEVSRNYLVWALSVDKERVFNIHFNKFFLKWMNTYLFLINLFFYEQYFLTLGSSYFKKETIALNWYYFDWDPLFWKFAFPFFLFKLNYFSTKLNYFYSRIAKKKIKIVFIPDYYYHYKGLYILQKNFFFTIGLLDLTINPFKLNYGIFAPKINTYFILLFYSFVLQTQKYSTYLKFLFIFKNWNNFYQISSLFKL